MRHTLRIFLVCHMSAKRFGGQGAEQKGREGIGEVGRMQERKSEGEREMERGTDREIRLD